MSIKILLDRSIFHGEKFNLLLDSPLARLSSSFKFSIYGSPILIEETLRLWFKGQKDIAAKHLKYIFDITNTRWFKSRGEIWIQELDLIGRSYKYFFMSREEVEETRRNLSYKIIEGNLDPKEEPAFRQQLAEQYRKDSNIREDLLKMRSDVSEKLRGVGKTRRDIKQGFGDYCLQNIDSTGEELIRRHLPSLVDMEDRIRAWKANKDLYPYFTCWVKDFLFLSFHAMSEPNDRVDRNAIRDIGQLVDLQGLDIMVSDDNRFMKTAFLEFYEKSKKFMNLTDFLGFMRAL